MELNTRAFTPNARVYRASVNALGENARALLFAVDDFPTK